MNEQDQRTQDIELAKEMAVKGSGRISTEDVDRLGLSYLWGGSDGYLVLVVNEQENTLSYRLLSEEERESMKNAPRDDSWMRRGP